MLEEIAEPLIDWVPSFIPSVQTSELCQVRSRILVLYEEIVHSQIRNQYVHLLKIFLFCDVSFSDKQKVNGINGFKFRIY